MKIGVNNLILEFHVGNHERHQKIIKTRNWPSNDPVWKFLLLGGGPLRIRIFLPEPTREDRDEGNIVFPEAAEFERLRKLHDAGVPVPRPHSFLIHTSADGQGSTAVLMEMIEGKTLRDWLSCQKGGRTEKSSGRSVHPVPNYKECIKRLDVAIATIASLQKLKAHGMFVDFKPRNIMIREKIRPPRGQVEFEAFLVDIGGVVMYSDTESSPLKAAIHAETGTFLFKPIKDRYLIETTCSYLSPEMALVITEYDFWKSRLSNHFFRTRAEEIQENELACRHKLEMVLPALFRQPHLSNAACAAARSATPRVDLYVTSSYLRDRQSFIDVGVITPASYCPKAIVSDGSAYPDSTNSTIVSSSHQNDSCTDCVNPACSNAAHISSNKSHEAWIMEHDDGPCFEPHLPPCSVNYPPLSDDIVTVNEKSVVFTLGLVIVELFGGRRTGLTALTRLKAINDHFLGDASPRTNQEFRIVLEWERNQIFLNGSLPPDCPPGEISQNNEDTFGDFNLGLNTYFNLFRTHCYPTDGVLSARAVSPDLLAGKLAIHVRTLLDSCLRFNPKERIDLAEVKNSLIKIRRLVWTADSEVM